MITFPLFALFVCVVNLLVVIIALYPYTQPVHLSITSEGRGIGYPTDCRLNRHVHAWHSAFNGTAPYLHLLLRVC